MKARTLFFFAIVIFLAYFEISASDKGTPTASKLRAEEVVKTLSNLPEQQQLEPTQRAVPGSVQFIV